MNKLFQVSSSKVTNFWSNMHSKYILWRASTTRSNWMIRFAFATRYTPITNLNYAPVAWYKNKFSTSKVANDLFLTWEISRECIFHMMKPFTQIFIELIQDFIFTSWTECRIIRICQKAWMCLSTQIEISRYYA